MILFNSLDRHIFTIIPEIEKKNILSEFSYDCTFRLQTNVLVIFQNTHYIEICRIRRMFINIRSTAVANLKLFSKRPLFLNACITFTMKTRVQWNYQISKNKGMNRRRPLF